MPIIVFTANVESGIIKVPKEYQTQLKELLMLSV